MRRCTVLALAALVLLFTACTHQQTVTEPTDAAASLPASDGVEIALPETTQDVSETQTETQIETTTAPAATTTTTTTTQPPVLTTDPPDTTMPPESGSASFTVNCVRFYREYTPDQQPTADIADSRGSLDGILDSVKTGYSPNAVRADDFAAYTDEWFATHRLIVVCVQENSGSIGHDVRKVDYTQSGAAVTIKRTCPQVQTCDIANWLICVELPDERLHAGDPVHLVWE